MRKKYHEEIVLNNIMAEVECNFRSHTLHAAVRDVAACFIPHLKINIHSLITNYFEIPKRLSVHRGYYTVARRYEFYVRVARMSERSEQVRL